MTLDTTLSKALYQGNSSATQFPFAFKVWEASELLVSVSCSGRESRDVTAQCDIELTDAGGIVTYPREGVPLPEGCSLSIVRNMPFTQGIDLVSASRFDPQVIEDGLDQATAERQQLLEQLSRAVILPPTSEQSPQEVVEEIYAARDLAGQSATDAAASAEAAKNSATVADTAAQLAGQCREQACGCANRAAQARDVALEQTVTINTVMATELAKINALVAANKDDQAAAIAQARQWAENPEDAPVAADPEGNPEYSARHWALKSSQLMAGDASKTRKGVVRVGEGIEVKQGVISVPLATDAAPGLVRPDNVSCAVDAAGVLRGISMLCNTREVLTESGTYIVRVTGWYRVRCIGAGGAGGVGAKILRAISDLSYGPGGDAGGTTQFGDLPPARGGGGGAGGGIRGSGACPSSGGGGGAGEVVDSYTFLTAGTLKPYNVGAGAPRNNGAYGSAAVMPGKGIGAGRYDGQGALGAGTSTTSQWNAGQGGAYGSIGGNGGINGTGYGSGGGGGQCLDGIYNRAGGGIAASDAENGWSADNGTSTIPEISYGGAGGNGAIILEFYDPNKLAAAA